MTKQFFRACSVLLLLCGCTKTELTENDAGKVQEEFTVGISLPGTSKTSLLPPDKGVYPAVWSEGDCISMAGNRSLPLTAAEAGKNKAIFKFKTDVFLPFNIIYPASDKTDEVHFAPVQAFKEGTFDQGAAPMYGATKEFGDVSLHHLSSVLRFLLKAQDGHNEKITKVVVSSLGAEPLSGDFVITTAQDGLFTGEITGLPDCSSSTILDCGEGVELSSANESAFYLCIPYGTYSRGFKAEFIDDAAEAMTLYFLTDGKGGAVISAGSVKEFPVAEFKAEEKVFIIADEKDLRDFAADAASCSKAILCSDIDIQGEWTPITGFTGEFDGSMHTISGLDGAMFGEVSDGVIRDLKIASNVTKCSDGYLASLVTILADKGRVVNCHYIGDMTASLPADASHIGGLVGRMDGTQAEISNCSCSGSINATYNNTGSVYAGSIVAYANAGTLRNCSFSGTVSLNGNSKNAFAGGIAGRCQTDAVLSNCENKGKLTSGTAFKTTSLCFFGGTVGYSYGITGCINSGIVECQGSSVAGLRMGGVAGTSCNTIYSCTNNGKVILSASVITNTAYVGGIAGNLDKAPSLTLTGLRSTSAASVTLNSPNSATCICEGGILGTSNLGELTLDDCVNEGIVETNGSCSTYTPGLLLGGIMGGTIRDSVTVLTFNGCRNKGKIHVEEQKNSSNRIYAGGIIGLAGSGAKGKSLDITIKDCHNEADLTRMVNNMVYKEGDRAFCGGICGAIGGDNRSHNTYDNAGGVVSSCTNSGTLIFNRFCGETTFKEEILNDSYTGGIIGVTNSAAGYQTVVSKCENSGNILSTAGYCAGIVAFSNLGTRICGEKTSDGVIFTKNSGRIGMFNPDNNGETGGGYLLSGGICACLKESSYAVAIEYCSNEGLVAASADGKIGAGGIVADLRISDVLRHCKNNGIVRFLPSSRCSDTKAVATGQISGKGSDFKVRNCAVGGRYGRKGNPTAGLDKFGGDEKYLFSKFIYALTSDITTQSQLDVAAPGCTWWDGVTPPDWEKAATE